VIKVEYEHAAQGLGSAFLRALAIDDADAVWELLSRESRGLLEGRYAARAGMPLRDVAAMQGERIREAVAPLRDAALTVLGGTERVNGFGVSAARVVDRATAYVLLLPEFGEERIVTEADWRPSYLLAFVNESRQWLVDIGRTATLSADAGLPDPLGAFA
jgi:hypothetical protein